MIVGVPKERRPFEFRVGLTPTAVQMLVSHGHSCYVEHDAGVGAGFSDQEYEHAGARIAYSAHETYGRADLLLKVSRPTFEELDWMQPGGTMMGLLHLAWSRKDKVAVIQEKGLTTISYEHIRLSDGCVPVRRPLSQIGGRLVGQIGAHLLQNDAGGKGILLGGVAGVPPAEVVVIGAGVFGTYAVGSFVAMGAHVTVLDTNMDALHRVYDAYPGIVTMISNPSTVARAVSYADVVVAGVLVPDDLPPMVITREMVRQMKPRSLIMDISIDEGGCVETSRLTTHEHPMFVEEGVFHYCVPNIPSIVARTSTYAFLNAAFPYILEIADKGVEHAVAENPAIENAAVIYKGENRHLARLVPEG